MLGEIDFYELPKWQTRGISKHSATGLDFVVSVQSPHSLTLHDDASERGFRRGEGGNGTIAATNGQIVLAW